MNKVFLSGNLTRDPEVRYSQSGMAFARMGIAVNRRSKNKDVKEVDFFNIVAFDKTAEFCGRYLLKGSRVLLEGRLQTSSYEAQDGSKRTNTEILIDNIEFAGAKRSNDDGDGYARNNRGYDDGNGYSRNNRGDDDGGYSRNNRSDDSWNDRGDSGYTRNNRGDDGNYSSNNPTPARENPPQKNNYNDEFIGDQLDIEDPPF